MSIKPLADIKPLIVIAILLILNSCSPTPDGVFNRLKELEGKWSSVKSPSYSESWTVISDSLISGLAYSLKGEDTLYTEQLKIVRKGEDIYYMALVSNQNDGEWISFTRLKAEGRRLNNVGSGQDPTWLRNNGKIFVFENLEHDFPNRIIYNIVSETELMVLIENSNGNKSTEFYLKRE